MVVQKLFWHDPYLCKLDAVIASIRGNVITLDKTIFYAFSGGQASDKGTIGSINVLEAKKNGMEIEYTLEDASGLSLGKSVPVEIDWNTRYKLMRLHFAAEIVLELVYRRYGHPKKIGANITIDKARVDFAWEGNISEIFSKLKEDFSSIVQKDYAIKSDFEDLASQRRFWEIEGFAKVPCGGTHIRKTSEVGEVSFKRKRLGENKERIEIYLEN